jgi:arylsulfatase A-like enzyme
MPAHPNIIYILADDMGYGDLSCLNPNSKIRTSHLDAMAARGMAFTDAHSSSAVCTPSRYSILTGRYNWRSWLKEGVTFGYDKPVIESGRMTVASLLREHGYATACIGKWHLGWNWTKSGEAAEDVDFTGPIAGGPVDCGFDYFYGMAGSLDMPPYVYIENRHPTAPPDRIVEESTGKAFWRAGLISPDFDHQDCLPNFTRRAKDYIQRQSETDKPYFLYFPIPAPHTPILPAAEFVGKSGTNAYGDFCLMVDDVVGQIRAAVEASGQADNTIIVFTSDNGCSPMADFPELATFDHNPSHIFRGHKADIYEGGHRIPLVIEWPAGICAGTTSDETVCLGDMLATCAEIVGAPLPDNAGEDSISNLAVWSGKTLDSSLREATVHHSIDGSFSIRQGKWKLEMCPGSGGWSFPKPGAECEGLPPVQLYDLAADIGERVNVEAEHPEVVAKLQALLTDYVRTGRSTPGGAPQSNHGGIAWRQLWWMLSRTPEQG